MCRVISLSVVEQYDNWLVSEQRYEYAERTIVEIPNYTGIILNKEDWFSIKGKAYIVTHREVSLFSNEMTLYVKEVN